MFKNLKLGTMAIGGFAIVLILTAIVAYVGYNGLAGVADRVNKADDVNRLVKDMLASRQQEKNFIIRGDKEYADKVRGEVANIRKQANETKAKFTDPVNRQQMDDVLNAVGRYEKAFEEYVGFAEKQKVADGNMVKNARELQKVADDMRQEQKADYEELRKAKASAAQINDKLTKADDANRIIKWSLESRRQEKNFIMRGDPEYAKKVERCVGDIVNLSKDLKSRFNQAKNQQQADQIIVATQGYKAAFDEFVTLKEKQKAADANMVAGARAVQEVCDKARADQKAKMEAEMSTANKTVFSGTIIAILLGLACALCITRAISGGIGKVVGNIKQVADDATNGKLDSRADVEAAGIDFKAIPAGLNNVLDAVIGPLNVTAEYVDRISKGDIPEKITDEYKGDFNEIKNNLNQCIDAVNALVGDANMLVEAAVEGKLDTRADATKHGGDFGKVVEGVNKTLDAVIGPLNVAAEYVDRISKGDIPEKITDEYNGDFNEIKNNLNQCIDAVNALVGDANMLVEAAVEGKLDTRADATKHGGDFGKIVEGVNKTLDAVIGPLKVAAEYVDRISKGDVPEKITDEYNGDFNEIKNNLNMLIDSLNMITTTAEKMADGDLAVSVQARSDRDELMKALAKMVANLNNVLGQVNVAGEQIASGSQQVADSSQSLSQGATEQASSLEEITSSMNEMGSQTKQNAENATQANQLATQARDAAEKGNDQMKEMVGAMSEINESSQNISRIIKVIDEIAFQTNLLALNAAVEAARAGKHGKGFAVVAEEVRNLAARSAKAAKETAELIEGSVKKVEDGTGIANKTAEALAEIVDGVGKATDLVGEIAAASNEQAQGIAQVNQGLGQIDQVTQQNTANAEESSSASEELSSQAVQLREMLTQFKLAQGHTGGQPGSRMVSETRRNIAETGRQATADAPKSGNGGAKKGNGGEAAPWGGNQATAPALVASQEGEPSIALDDKEFGKY
jgi:methyl-accepting chemotaxis protein